MSDNSPLFVSALELIAQATELYAEKHPRKYKFVILHLANAIELILKDRLIDKGVSIYKPKSSETIGVWSAFEELAKLNVVIPEKPIMELLIDDRNTIQHRFGFPNADSVYYYLENVIAFFKRFLVDEYSVQLGELLSTYLSKEHLAILGFSSDPFSGVYQLAKVSPKSAVIEAGILIDNGIVQFIDPKSEYSSRPYGMLPTTFRHQMLSRLESNSFVSDDFVEKLQLFRRIRNEAAHLSAVSEKDVHDSKWKQGLQLAKEIMRDIEKVKASGVKFAPDAEIDNDTES